MLYPVIMAGGSGTRFWPRSRHNKPKQLIQVIGTGTMIQQTVSRLSPELSPDSFLVITNAAQVAETRRQLPQLAPEQIIGEPCGRDTSAAIGLGAAFLHKRDPEAVMAVLAADQVISPASDFLRCIREAARVAVERRALVTLGIKPSHPSELYGYIRRGRPLGSLPGALPAYQVAEFKEKPRRAQAEEFIRSGEYYWNSGNFVWRTADILDAMRQHLPELHHGLQRMTPMLGTPRQPEMLEREYPGLPKVSIDYGVMEKASNATVIEAALVWDDVGSWDAIARHQPADEHGNVVLGLHAGHETRDNIIVGEGHHLIATVGVKDLIIVHTPDATLVCDRRRAADVKALVELLKSRKMNRYL
jgi:mannose-1-phosphate guanylyltransferase